MNTFTEEIMNLSDSVEIELHCFTVRVEPTGDGFYFVGNKYDNRVTRMTRHELFEYMRDNNCWADEDRTIQYFCMNRRVYKMTWAQYEDNRWAYTGTVLTEEEYDG